MKKQLNFNLWLMMVGFALALILLQSCNKTRLDNKPIYIEYFKKGQILLPDYACPDTMIVRDHIGLNKALSYLEQTNSSLVETDDEIDSLFHQYCDYYVGSFEDQFHKLKRLMPQEEIKNIAFEAFYKGYRDCEAGKYCPSDIKMNFDKFMDKRKY